MKNKYSIVLATALIISIGALLNSINQEKTEPTETSNLEILHSVKPVKKEKKSIEEKAEATLERLQFDYNLFKNPITGTVTRQELANQLVAALEIQSNTNFTRESTNDYVSRGPSNLGGRTRSIVVDLSDPTSNTLIAGGVSSGVFRTTDGGESWTRTSSNNDIHNVTTITQDPRDGFQDIWYYGTGEFFGNSASVGGPVFLGQGVYQSNNGGLNWQVIPETSSIFQDFDSDFDRVHALEVSPTTGTLFIATVNSIYSYDGTDLTEILVADTQNAQTFTDIDIDASGRIYASIGGDENNTNGVYISEDEGASFTRIAQNGNPAGWGAVGRTVLATAPSNDNYLYALYANGANSGAGQIEADLWRYDRSTGTWEDFSSKLPDLPGGNIGGVDPFAVQGGYDLIVNVSFTDENYVVIGGTSAYRIRDIEADPMFEIIGGYNGVSTQLYNTPNGDVHHPDIHDLVFDPFIPDVLYSGSDGGVHRTDNIDANIVDWVNLNNNYETYQYYDVFLDQLEGSDIVIGGAQDNGTTAGGQDLGLPNDTDMVTLFGGDGVSVGLGRPANGNFLAYLGFQSGNIFRVNLNTGSTVSIRPNNATNNGLFVTLFHVDPDNTQTLYYANQFNLFRTTNAQAITGSTWDELGNLPVNQRPRSLANTRGDYDPNTSYLLVGGENGRIFRLDDPHNAASLDQAVDITPEDAFVANGSIVSSLAVHPTNRNIAIATYSSFGIPSIFITENASSPNPTWTNVENNLELFSVRASQIIEVDGQTQYFVGTARGLYSSLSPLTGDDWSPEGVDQIGIPLVSTLEYRPSDGVLLIGTHGNGMFQTETETLGVNDPSASLSPDNLQLFPNPAVNELTINLDAQGLNFTSFEIIDSTGRIIAGDTFDSTTQRSIDVSSFTQGVYFARVITQDNQVLVKRFLKN